MQVGVIHKNLRGNMTMLDGRACGLLPGVGALALRERRLTEAVARVEDLPRVQGWAFLSSLRGWIWGADSFNRV